MTYPESQAKWASRLISDHVIYQMSSDAAENSHSNLWYLVQAKMHLYIDIHTSNIQYTGAFLIPYTTNLKTRPSKKIQKPSPHPPCQTSRHRFGSPFQPPAPWNLFLEQDKRTQELNKFPVAKVAEMNVKNLFWLVTLHKLTAPWLVSLFISPLLAVS